MMTVHYSTSSACFISAALTETMTLSYMAAAATDTSEILHPKRVGTVTSAVKSSIRTEGLHSPRAEGVL